MNTAQTAHADTRRILTSQRGMSLLETMVALGLFAITAAGMSSFLVHQIRGASSGHLDTVAYSLAADALEEARAGDFGDLVTGSTTFSQGGVTFTTTTQVQNDTPVDGVKTVTAQVSWGSPSGLKQITVPVVYTKITRF